MKVKKFHLFFILSVLINFSCNNDSDESTSIGVLSENRYGGSKDEEFRSSILTSDGGQIVLARTPSTDGDLSGNISYTDPTSNFSNYNVWVLKLNSSGKIEWQKTYGGSQNEIANRIIQTNDGGYLFSGMTNSIDGDIKGKIPSISNPSNISPWIVKISSKGNIEWQSFGDPNEADNILDIVQTTDGGFTYCTYDKLVKIDSKGSFLWSSTIDFHPNYMTQLSNGELLLTGYKNAPSENYVDYVGILGKFSSTGMILWENSFNRSLPNKVTIANDGGLFIVGSTLNLNVPNYHSAFGNDTSDAWVAKLNSLGNIEWQKAFGGTSNETATDIIKNGDDYYIGANATSSNGDLEINNGDADYWILKINNTGTIIWQKVYGGKYTDNLGSIFKLPNGNLILTGMSNSIVTNVSDIYFDIWILKIKE